MAKVALEAIKEEGKKRQEEGKKKGKKGGKKGHTLISDLSSSNRL
jgi:hypothetical protein